MSNKEIKKFSKKEGNLEIIREDKKPSAQRDLLSNKNGNNIVIGTLNIMVAPLKSRHEKHYKESTFHLIADIVLVLAVVVMAISLYIVRHIDLSMGIETSIETKNESIVSGRLETFDFYYKNNSKERIEDASLSVKLPPYFEIKKINPENLFDFNNHTFSLGDMENGANGKVSVSGLVFSGVGNYQLISTSFNFFQNGTGRNVLNSLSYGVDDSALSFQVNMPEIIYQNSLFTGISVIRNGSEQNFSDIEFLIGIDKQDINSVECSDCIVEGNKIKYINIPANSEKSLVFEARFKNENIKEALFTSFFKVNNDNLMQQSLIKKIVIKKPKLNTQIIEDMKAFEIGDALKYKINLTNEEESTINNIQLKINSLNKNFKIKSILEKDKSKEVSFDNNVVIIDKIEVGETVNFEFEVLFDRYVQAMEQNVGIVLETRFNLGANVAVYNTYSKTIKVLSSVGITSGGYYYSKQGDQLGVGPVPPIVGIPTKYWIFWEVDNYGNDLEDFVLSAKLPENVVFTNNKTLLTGDLVFDENNREINWRINQISKEGGKNITAFELSLIPTQKDAGKVKELLVDIGYFYKDSFCREPKTGELKKISTRLIEDKNILTDGMVQD